MSSARLVLPPRYELIAPLGKGGGGEVWSVRDRITGRTVALKVLAEGADEREAQSLVREAVALSGVEGLGLPRVFRFGRLRGSERAYMVRELVQGASLAELIAKGAGAGVLLAAIAEASDKLTLLHRALLLHGDIKPANIVVGEDGHATLVDLGLAEAWGEVLAKPAGLTPKYAAPELFQGAELSVRAEIFALGVTLSEVLKAVEEQLDEGTREALRAVVQKATAASPSERYPSADELASALRRAAHMGDDSMLSRRGLSADASEGTGKSSDGARAHTPVVWPVLGLEAPAGQLLEQIAHLRPGSGIVVTGPRGAGRTTLLRRIAWSLGIEGQAVLWVEAAEVENPAEAIALELLATEESDRVIALIDDAEKLSLECIRILQEVREKGGKVVLATSAEHPSLPLGGPTLEVFQVPPLPPEVAYELVRRTVPSLGDTVIAHIVARAQAWPGTIREIVSKLAGQPVVSASDVDRILDEETMAQRGYEDIHRLLDRGHFEEAAEALERYTDDRSAQVGIARARLWTNRGDTARAFAELSQVEEEALRGGSLALAAAYLVYSSRAHLRAGDYAEAERNAAEVGERLGLRPVAFGAEGAETASLDIEAHERIFDGLSPELKRLLSDATAMRGLAQSLAGRSKEAKLALQQAVRMAKKIGEPRILSVGLSSLAFVLQRENQLSEAKRAYEEALSAAEQAGDAGSVATIRLNLATIAKQQADLATASRHLEAAVDMGKRSGRVATLRQALLNLANLDLYLSRVARARVSLDALAEQKAELPPQLHAQLLALEAEYAAQTGNLEAAEHLCEQCAHAYESIGRNADAAEAMLERILFAAARPNANGVALMAAVRKAEQSLSGTMAHKALYSLARGKAAALSGNENLAKEAYDAALEAARDSGPRDLIWRTLEARAELCSHLGQSLKARRDREEALAVLEEIASRLPRDLREVFWNDPRRRSIRSTGLSEMAAGTTVHINTVSEDKLARVLEINRAIAGEVDLPRLLEKVTDHAIALLHAERGSVILRSGYAARSTIAPASASSRAHQDLSVYASRDQSGNDPHASFSHSIAEKVIKSGEPIVTTNVNEDLRMREYVSVHRLMLQSIACVPIRARSGDVIGALYLETRMKAAAGFTDELSTLLALSDQVAIAIETARLVGENERRARELEQANNELLAARNKLEELLGHRTEQLAATKRDLKNARAVLRGHFGYEGLCGTSVAMRRVYAMIDRIKDTDVPVLITGESGTGKEMVARAIHNAGPRARKPFVGINCGAIPEHLLESELFGHVRGAFTGADRERKGLLREATEGTILLDEIGEMPQKMQAGLLRVLQEKVVRPVGGNREEPVGTRIIAATHRDLSRMVADSLFREDLYYRLHVIEIRVPPLRERIEDIPILIDHFLRLFAARYNRDRRIVSRAALKKLMAYSWPGNVRQLENVLLNAWVLSDAPELDEFELPEPTARHPAAGRERDEDALRRPIQTSLDAHRADERERILEALTSCNWNRVKAAQMVGLPRRTFYRRLKEYGIQ